MNFCSDNATGASPQVLEAMVRANEGYAMPYGEDRQTKQAEDKIRNVFDHDAAVFFVATGTAANALSLAVLTPSYGAILCHPSAHLIASECGAPEFFTGGARLLPMDDDNGCCTPAGFDTAWGNQGRSVHDVQISAISLTQITEAGTLYDLDTITTLSDKAHERGLHVHMDGARFANAVAALDCHPADLTWRAGVDILSFGGSKNGCFGAEAVVIFNPDLAHRFSFYRKRAGHLFSKMRFIAAQMDAYVTDDLWLENARQANAMATRMAKGLSEDSGIDLLCPPPANMLYAAISEGAKDGLESDGFQIYRDVDGINQYMRIVTAFNTDPEQIDAFVACVARHS